MPSPNTGRTLLALLGMLAGGFGKGAMMAEMAQDEGVKAEKEAKLKRKEALEDKAIDMLGAIWGDQTLPYEQRKKAGTSLSQFYSNLGGEAPAQFAEPYEMTSAERAQGMMQDPVTFRHGMTQMLKRDEVDPKLPYQIKEIESRIKLNNQRLVNLRKKETTTNQIKRLDPYVKQKYDLLIKRAEFVAKELKQYEGMREGYRAQHEDIIKELVEEMNQYLDDAEKLLITAEGGFDPSPYEIKRK